MNYLITEAVSLKAAREENDAREEAIKADEMKRTKKDAQAELARLFR